MYLCVCKGLKLSDVQEVTRSGRRSPERLIADLGLDDPRCCGRCARRIDRFVVLSSGPWAETLGARQAPLPQP